MPNASLIALGATALMMLHAAPGSAELVEVDLFAPGDALLLHDTWTGLVWLDLPETAGESYDSVAAGFGGFTTTEGFRHATDTEVSDLFFSSAGMSPGVFQVGNRPGAELLLGALGCTSSCGTGSDLMRGVTARLGAPGTHASAFVELHPDGLQARAASVDTEFDDSLGDPSRGSFLVRNAIPRPPPPNRLLIDGTGDGNGNLLDDPQGVAVDAFGNVFVSGRVSHNAFKIDPSGSITQIIDATGDGAGNALSGPSEVRADAAGNVFVAGTDSHNVFKITSAGSISAVMDATGDGAGNTLQAPTNLAVDGSGNLYVVGLATVFRVTPAGVVTRMNGPPAFFGDVDVDAAGTAFGTDILSQFLVRIEPGGALTNLYPLNGAPLGISPIAVLASGNLAVGVHSGGGPASFDARVVEVTPSGVETTLMDVGGDGAGNFFDTPNEIDVDSEGNIYASTESIGAGGTANVFQIAPGGEIWELIDQTGDGTNPLFSPSAVAAGTGGKVYVADRGDRVFEISLPVAVPGLAASPLLVMIAVILAVGCAAPPAASRP